MNEAIITMTGYVRDTYLMSSEFSIVSSDLNIDDIYIPDIFDVSSSLILNDDDLILLLDNTKNDFFSSRLSSIVVERERRTNILSSKIDELEIIKDMRSYVKISFSPYEPYYTTWTKIDDVQIDGKKVEWNITFDGEKITYHVSGIFPNRYELRLKKKDYLDVVFNMQTKITNDFDTLEEFYLGNINMLSKQQQLRFIFTWGELPYDLDTHIYSFRNEYDDYMEHAYFLQLKSDKSMIDIDVDDVTSFGPETTHIFKPNYDKWYLLTIHNYSRYVKEEETNEEIDPEGLVNVKVKLYDFDLDVKPTVDLYKRYWWDVLLVHNNKIYVINAAPDDRMIDYSHNLTYKAKKRLIELAKNCQEIYDISRYKPTVIRFY